LDLKTDLNSNDNSDHKLTKLNHYQIFRSGMKFLTPIELITTLTKTTFNDPYLIRYNKQLLHVLLRGND